MTTATEVLAGLQERLRSEYVLRRTVHINSLGTICTEPAKLHPKWDGGVDARGVTHRGIWLGLARCALEQRLDPRTWVEALFSLTELFDHVPWPSDLKDPRVLKRTAQWPEHRHRDIVFALRTERLTVARETYFRQEQSALSRAAVLRTVVVDPTLDLSPLTRYATAVRSQLPELASLYVAAALAQYRAAPRACDEAYGGQVPGDLAALLTQLDAAVPGEAIYES
jgi:hypothetical protein